MATELTDQEAMERENSSMLKDIEIYRCAAEAQGKPAYKVQGDSSNIVSYNSALKECVAQYRKQFLDIYASANCTASSQPSPKPVPQVATAEETAPALTSSLTEQCAKASGGSGVAQLESAYAGITAECQMHKTKTVPTLEGKPAQQSITDECVNARRKAVSDGKSGTAPGYRPTDR